MTQGKVRQPSHYDIQKVIHKSSPDGYCATRKAEQEPEEEQGKLLEKDVAPKGLGGGGGDQEEKKKMAIRIRDLMQRVAGGRGE